ncbi:MAG: hypothetical protein K9N38_09030 [Candidatus Marinimicrobia bacterium]|nr:hypothetical protein [Candidatus Neomarinimicrobiota bacterium]MCF7851310.1 hypothetical protein [Candidatus Neomarinimicrobiota bacterium]
MPQAIEAFHEKEYGLFLSQVGFIHPSQMRIIFSGQIGQFESKPQLKPILLAGHAKIASLEGYFPESASLLEKALKEASRQFLRNDNRNSRSALAYVHYEYGVFYKMLRSSEQSFSHFSQALHLKPSQKLTSLIKFFIELHVLENKKEASLDKLTKLVEKFQSRDLTVMQTLGLHWLGNFSRDWDKPSEARRFYGEALHLAEQNSLLYMVWNIKNSFGLFLKKQKKIKKAISHYEGFIDSIESHYLKSITQKNLANLYRDFGKERKAIELAKDGLEYAKRYGVISTIPTYGWFIGQMIVTYTDQPQKAHYYFKAGYDESISQRKAGIPLTGPRLSAVTEYVNYISKYIPEELEKISTAHYFEWTAGRSWVNIQDLFHYNLFAYHYVHTGIGDPTFKHLEFNQNSFQTMKKRMRDMRGIHFPNFKRGESDFNAEYFIDSMQQYIAIHKDKTYKLVKEQFERDVFEYLYKNSGYNKVNLAKSLDVAYGTIIRKTKPITDSVEPHQNKQLEAPR